jgi:hypothetical protein
VKGQSAEDVMKPMIYVQPIADDDESEMDYLTAD